MEDDLFRAENLDLSAYLIYNECVPVKFERKGRRVVFCFKGRVKCNDLAQRYMLRGGQVEPMGFANAMDNVRDMYHSEISK